MNGKAVAAIMAGVTESDVGVVWKIWVDEEYRDQGLRTWLICLKTTAIMSLIKT